MRRTIILAAALAIILLGLWGTAVIYFDEARLKGIVSDRLSEQIGRRVEIGGALEFNLFPRLELNAGDVVIAGSENDDGQAMLRAKRVSMSLRFLPLLQGELAPGRMQLGGAVVNLAASKENAGPADPLAAIRSSARLLSGQSLRLRDVTVVLPSDDDGAPRSVVIDYIALDRFSLDRNVAFRFRGELGEPPLIEEVNIDGMLHVPTSPDIPIRLRNMQLKGRLAQVDRPVSLSGDLTAARADPFRLALAGGQLRVGRSQYDMSFNIHSGNRRSADLLLSGPVLDWSAIKAFSTQSMGVNPASALAEISSRVDLRSQLQFDRLRIGDAVFAEARIDLRSHRNGLGVSLATVFPGGLIEASGVLTHQSPRSLALDASLSEFGRLLEWLELPAALEGSGEAQLTLSWPRESGSGFELEGRFDLWDGHWRVAGPASELADTAFDRFSGELRMTPGYLEVPRFQLTGSEIAGRGWAAVDLSGQELGGELRSAEQTAGWLSLSGSLSQPQLTPLTPPASDQAGEPIVEDDQPDQ